MQKIIAIIACSFWLVQATAQPNIVAAEYFIDTDPGFGNATPITITSPSANVINQAFAVPLAAVSQGVHTLFIRSKDANGKWSITNRLYFYKPAPVNSLPPANITQVEYFIDTDPGIGNAVPVVVNPASNIADFISPINISGLSVGDHKLYIRSRTNNGWSITNIYTFPIATTAALPFINVNAITKTAMCEKDSVSISFDAKGGYNAGNIFNVQLSDATGSFASPVIIGSYNGTKSAIIPCKLPDIATGGTNYRVRVSSTNPVVTGLAGSDALTIGNKSLPQSITGAVIANGTLNYGYNIPAVTGSTWNWIIAGGVQQGGTNTNSIGLIWSAPPPGTTTQGMIKLVESNYGCNGDTSILNATLYKLRIGISTPAAVCKAFAMTVTANADGVFGAGNILTAQLSDAAGSFAAPVVIGTLPLVGVGLNQLALINTIIPAATPNGNNYRVRIISTTGSFIGDTSAAISIQKPAIGADLARSKCPGFGYNLQTDYTDGTLTYTYFNNSFVLLPNATNVDIGTYNVIGTNSNGCVDTAVVTVTNNVKPNIGADTTIYHNCPGETTNLIPLYTTTGLTASWNTGIPSAAPPGVYRLIVTNASGCSDTAFANIILEVASWTGTTSNNWHTASNWNINKVPGQQTHVIIPSGTVNPCNISAADGEAASIQVKTGATLTMSNSRKLLATQKCNSLPPN